MAKGKTTLDTLTRDIARILDEYESDVIHNVPEISAKLAKKGAQALKREARAKFPGKTGDYAKGWKVESSGKKHRQVEWSNTIYNAQAGLPHLLEHGHATRNGDGRSYPDTPAHEHIAPIEKELVEAYEKEVLSRL